MKDYLDVPKLLIENTPIRMQFSRFYNVLFRISNRSYRSISGVFIDKLYRNNTSNNGMGCDALWL